MLGKKGMRRRRRSLGGSDETSEAKMWYAYKYVDMVYNGIRMDEGGGLALLCLCGLYSDADRA